MSESFTVIARYDEAIDAEGMSEDDRISYRETFDTSLLKFLPGEQPTRWHCRRLRTSEMRDVLSQPNDSDKYMAAFARGLVRVEGKRDDGVRSSWTRPTDKPLTDKVLDTFDLADVLEVGAAIFGRSHLGKGRPAAWPLPATSRLAVAALVSRRAEEMRRSALSAPSSPPAEEAPATPSSSPAGETPGAATATASSAESPST